MKTTIDLSDALFNSAKELAQRRQTTLRSLVEEGLRRVLNDAQGQPKQTFKLKDVRVHGQAMLLPDVRDWQQLEDEHLAASLSTHTP